MKKKLFTLMTLLLTVCSGAWATDKFFYDGSQAGNNSTTPVIGTAAASTNGAVYAKERNNCCFKFTSTMSSSDNYFTITPTSALAAGDQITLGNFISAAGDGKYAQLKIEYYNGDNEKIATQNATQVNGSGTNDLTTNVAPTDEVLSVPAAAVGATYLRIGRGTGNKNFFVSKFIITPSSTPSLTVSPLSASLFSYIVDNGPSTAQSFTLSLANSTKPITATLSSDKYEMSKTGAADSYANTAITDLTNESTVYVRLKAGLSKGSYDGTLTFSNNDLASDVVLDLSGSVTNQTYTVTYDLNGASGDAPTETAKEAGAEFALAAAPTWDCHTFNGWLCNIDGVTYAAGDDYTMTAAPTTFTAQWTVAYASSTYDFENSATVGTSPSKTITTSEVDYDAFRIDNFFFGASKLAYDNGASDVKFKGWKIKKSGSTIKFMVENNSAVSVKLGANNGCNIKYTPIGSSETTEALSSTDNTTTTKNVAAGTIVTLTTTSNSTVCLKTIKISNVEAVSTASGKTYATYVTTNALDFAAVSDEIKAYVAASAPAAGNITFTGKDEIPASTPILVKTASAGATVYVPVIPSAAAISTNNLVAGTGSPINYNDGGKYNYILTNGQFKPANNSVVAVGKAYLSLADVAANELTISFDDEDGGVTGIQNLTPALSKGEGAVFDLQGRRVAQPAKGLYIVNGKKVVLK